MSPCDECGEYDCDKDCEYSDKCENCGRHFVINYFFDFNLDGVLNIDTTNQDYTYEIEQCYCCCSNKTDEKIIQKCCGTFSKHRKWCPNYNHFNREIKHKFVVKKKFDSLIFNENLICKICDLEIVQGMEKIENIPKNSELYNIVTYCRNAEKINEKIKNYEELIEKTKKTLKNYEEELKELINF